jgi:hypothetical protein
MWNRQAATTIRATTMEPGPTGELALCHAELEPCPELDIATVATMEQVSVLLVLMVLENLILLVATWVNAANGIGLAGQAAAKHQIARKISVCDSEVTNVDQIGKLLKRPAKINQLRIQGTRSFLARQFDKITI